MPARWPTTQHESVAAGRSHTDAGPGLGPGGIRGGPAFDRHGGPEARGRRRESQHGARRNPGAVTRHRSVSRARHHRVAHSPSLPNRRRAGPGSRHRPPHAPSDPPELGHRRAIHVESASPRRRAAVSAGNGRIGRAGPTGRGAETETDHHLPVRCPHAIRPPPRPYAGPATVVREPLLTSALGGGVPLKACRGVENLSSASPEPRA